ncbi:MAG TPA: DUF4192 domain-containing protein [Streptosporangiaceae bacterium]|nr:DUF4192 domain-containing protein [Streptosporangiaceae bacterium]
MNNASATDEPQVLRLRSPHDVIAAVPYLLGFHPADSLVAIGSERSLGGCALRLDLPADEHLDAAAEQIAALLDANGFSHVVLVGYGGAERVGPIMAAARVALDLRGVEVLEALRVADGRFWSCSCAVPGCCPPEGTPYDIGTSAIAAQATLAGRVALPGRGELARSVAPVGGAARESMRLATERAIERRVRRMFQCGGDRMLFEARMAADGVAHARDLLRRGGPLTDDEVAWLGVVLTHLRVRDEALVHTDSEGLDLWRDVLRRVETPFAAAPACLTAYAAYLSGDGALANVALDRAVEADPTYSMAALLRDIMLTGVPPALARLRVTSEALAEPCYDDHPP